MSALWKLIAAFSRFWDRVWFTRIDPLPVGVFRISLGILMLSMYLCLYPHWLAYYGFSGVLSLNEPLLHADVHDWLCLFNWTDGWGIPLRMLWGIAVLASLAFTLGWQTRAATIVLYVLEVSVIHRNRFAINGEDLVFRMLLFYACFASLGGAVSIDDWLRRRRLRAQGQSVTEPESIPVWPIRLMQINIALVYIISLPNKLVDDIAWSHGDAIYLSMVSNLWSRGYWPWLFYGWLGKLFTWGTILTEGTFPILVWFRKPRLYVIGAIASMHIGIAIFLKNVTFFSLSMVCSFLLFVPAETLRWAYTQLRSLWGKKILNGSASGVTFKTS